jgi:uncharacterized protein involved in outer membrane biogenesis
MIRKPRRWPLFVGGLLVLLVLLYLVATSGAFIRSVVLPRVSAAVGSEVTAEDVSVSPFSSVVLKGLKVVPRGTEPLLEVREVRLRYSLMAILGGNIQVQEVTVDGPSILVTEKADGSGNLATLLRNLPKSEESTSQPTSSKPPKLEVRNVAIRNGTVRYQAQAADGTKMAADVSGLQLTVDQLINGQTTRFAVSADAKANQTAVDGNSAVGGRLEGSIDLDLGATLIPGKAKGGIGLRLSEATGAFAAVSGLGVLLDTEMTAQELKLLALRFVKGNEELGRIGLSGALDLDKQEVRLVYDVRGIDRRVLALVGAASGVDLGDTSLTATGRVDVLKGGAELASNGRIGVNRLSVGTSAGRTPVVDFSTDYRVMVNQADKSAMIERLDLLGVQAGKEWLKGGLDRPMRVSWDKAATGFRNSMFALKLGPLDLNEWQMLLPTNAPMAVVTTELQVTAEQAGKALRYRLNTQLDRLATRGGPAEIRDAKAGFHLSGTLTDFAAAVVEAYQFDISMGGTPLLALTGLADWNLTTALGGVQMNLSGEIPPLLALYPVDGIRLQSGKIRSSFSASQRAAGASLEAAVSLEGLKGNLGTAVLSEYQTTLSVTGSKRGDEVDLQRFNFAAQSGFAQGGSMDARGKFNVASGTGTADFRISGFNESALAPFLAPALAPNRLVSVSLDAQGKADFATSGKAGAQLDVKLSNLVVDDPSGRLPKTPLGVALNLDANSDGRVTEVKRMELDLGATDRASNKLNLTARLDMGTNAPTPSTLALKSDGLDLTPYFDLFAGTTNAPATATTPAPGSDPNVEPEPIQLPVRDLTVDVDLARVYLREIDVAGFKGKVTAKNDLVSLENLVLTLNGAPVTARARANLAVPGYEYDVGFLADRVPMSPVVNSFVPVMNGMANGTFQAAAQIKGAGITGSSLSRNLGGSFGFGGTNVQITIPERSIPLPRLLVKLLPIFPDEINPRFILALIGRTAVLSEPVRVLELNANIANGTVAVSNSRVGNSAFLSEVAGSIRLNDILTNSPVDLPVTLAFASGNQLPPQRKIGRVAGTMGNTKFEKDLIGLAGVLGSLEVPGIGNLGTLGADAISNLGSKLGSGAGQVGNAVGNVVGNLLGTAGTTPSTNAPANPIGGILRGLTGTSTNTPSTNAPANPIGGILRGLTGTSTNTPSTNAPATNRIGNPLNLLPFGRDKK